jgi:hypothetical protein
MNLSRKRFWLLLQVIGVGMLVLYHSIWLFTDNTTGIVQEITKYKSVKSAEVIYNVNQVPYSTIILLDDDFSNYQLGQNIKLRYLVFAKGSAKGVGTTAGDMVTITFYVFYLLFWTVILILPNNIIEKDSRFIVNRWFPFIKYIPGKPRPKAADVLLIEKANLFAGYIERFMFPFIMCGCTGLVYYLFSRTLFMPMLIGFTGIVWGILRSRSWAKKLAVNDDELDAVDISLNTLEE